jgi:hypothetical protein
MSEEKTVIKTSAAEARAKRKERNSITGTRTKLSLTGEEPGFHYAWINEDNVGSATDAGFEFVTHAIKVGNKHIDVSTMQGGKISRNVGQMVVAYLMRIPQEWYDEDMAEEQRLKVDASEERIKDELNSNGLNGTLVKGSWDIDNPKVNRGY